MTDDEIRDACLILRQRVQRGAQPFELWDLILDAEALLQGKWAMQSREDIERQMERELLVR